MQATGIRLTVTLCVTLSIESLKAHPDSDTLPLEWPPNSATPFGGAMFIETTTGGIFALILFTRVSFPQFCITAGGIFCRYSYQIKEASFEEICRDAAEIVRVGRT